MRYLFVYGLGVLTVLGIQHKNKVVETAKKAYSWAKSLIKK
jgi:hypothetical protein